MTLRHTLFTVILSASISTAAFATSNSGNSNNSGNNSENATAADCLAMQNVYDCRKNFTMSPRKVKQCVQRGYDAPKSCRKDEGNSAGVRTGGSSGFSYGTIQSPEKSAGQIQAVPSINQQAIQYSFGLNWWTGPCMLPGGINLCANGNNPPDPSANLLCPPREDNSGHYGIKAMINTGSAMNYPCGAAVPLTTYETVLNKDPDHLLTTEYGSYYMWLYKKSTTQNQYRLAQGPADFKIVYPTHVTPPAVDWVTTPIPLPQFLCTGEIKTADIPPPIAQMITYKGSTATNLVIRLKDRSTFYVNGHSPVPPYNEGEPEKYLILPITNGQVQVPANCSDTNTYYKTLAAAGLQQPDIVIESATNDGCEGTNEMCAGLAPAPTPDTNCDVVSLLLDNAEPPAPACAGKTQYVILDRANLVYPPGTQAQMTKIEGRTAVLAPSLTGSRIFTQQNSIIRLGTGAAPIVFGEGAIIPLPDGTKINLNPSGSIEPATGKINFIAGGNRMSESGVALQTFTNGQYLTLSNPPKPIIAHMYRSMVLPTDYMVPTQPHPFAQAPTP